MEAWLRHSELSLNNHSVDATVHFLGDRLMKPIAWMPQSTFLAIDM
jgi:hypothetical protein